MLSVGQRSFPIVFSLIFLSLCFYGEYLLMQKCKQANDTLFLWIQSPEFPKDSLLTCEHSMK